MLTIEHRVNRFQSYLITALTNESARFETKKLAAALGINLVKVSPDIFFIRAQKQEIGIDQIRDLKAHIYQKPLAYQHKFVIIENSEHLTLEAQNALLKILEEPPSHAVLVLETRNKSLLLPTITSRTVAVSAHQKPQKGSPTLLDQNLESALEQITGIASPEEFLNEQIVLLTDALTQSVREKQPSSAIREAIEKCAYTKQLVDANANPTFALTNLVFSIKLASK